MPTSNISRLRRNYYGVVVAMMVLGVNWATSLTIQPQPVQAQIWEQDCRQLYPRLFFTSSLSQYIIKFNTVSPCTRSFVTINQGASISKHYCNSSRLAIQQSTLFVRYVQSCLATIDPTLPQFNYSVYGQPAGSVSAPGVVAMYLVNVPQKGQNMNVVVTADWGPLQVRKYQPIYPSLLREIARTDRPVHALLLIGDVAYDLTSRECQQYELFMAELSAVSARLPIIPILGNHQTKSANTLQIFRQTFECYNLSTAQRVQAYKFWNLKIVVFDPYLEIYQLGSESQYQAMKHALISQLEEDAGFTILSSHYPIICSQKVFHCRQTLLALPQLYAEVSNLGVDLYLGAHMHEYERIAPYRNGSFESSRAGPYGANQMPSIVEGVAGCDVGIVDEDYPVQNFSIAHSYNQTGYGMLVVSELAGTPRAQYIHYTTPSSQETLVFDRVIIDPSRKTHAAEQ